MSVVVKERDWETESVRSGHPRITTVRRYRVPERDEEPREEIRVIRRDVEEPQIVRYAASTRAPSPPREVRYRFVERDVSRSPPRHEDREVIKIEREVQRSPSPEVRSTRWERDYEDVPESPYQLAKYSKSTEYFSRPEPPQPIVIRQDPQPIIIQEQRPQVIVRREEPQYEIVERQEEERQVVRREEPPPPAPAPAPEPERDYYYERKVREIDRGRDYYEERDHRRRRPRHDDDRDTYSDDDVYIRRETVERDRSPHHKRHLAEGIAAGVGAAEIMRHHRKRQGEDPGHRGRQMLGYGALGAVGAEAFSRARNHWDREESRSRSDSRGRGRSRHRSRHRSISRGKALAGLGAVAAIGALAYAAGRGNKGQQPPVVVDDGRSRSRSRRHSIGGYSPDRDGSESRHVEPDHRNRRIAQAGLASAAVAGLVERARSRSQGRRSKSRVRTGGKITAAGLGGAALAGLYERNKARKEARKEAERPLSRSRSRSRSTSRPRSRSRGPPGEAALIEYGGDPIMSETGIGRRRSRSRAYEEPVDYRHRRSSSSSSPDPGRHRRRSQSSRSRSRSRSRGLAEAAGAAAVAGIAAHEATKRRERKKADKERRRYEEENSSGTFSPNDGGPYPPNDGGYPPNQYYPNSNNFPPPPHAADPYAQQPPNGNPYVHGNASYDSAYASQPAPYNPADYPAPPGSIPHEQIPHEQYYSPHSPPPVGAGGHPQDPYAQPGDPYNRRNPENMV